MTAQTPAPSAAKTPAEFQARAEEFNQKVAENASGRAEVQHEADALNGDREILIRLATDYGVTPKFARTLLRKP